MYLKYFKALSEFIVKIVAVIFSVIMNVGCSEAVSVIFVIALHA